MEYQEKILDVLKRNYISNNVVLDVASGVELRHPMIFKNYFKQVYGNDKEHLQTIVESKIKSFANIKMYWSKMEKIKHECKYDLISFCWPEMIPYQYFIDNVILLKKYLNKNGKILLIFSDEIYNDEHEELYLLSLRLMLLEHKQKYINRNGISNYLMDKGMRIVYSETGDLN